MSRGKQSRQGKPKPIKTPQTLCSFMNHGVVPSYDSFSVLDRNERGRGRDGIYSMLTRRVAGAVALGTTMLRIPFLRLAVTASWSTREGKVKVRWNSPTERSETQ